MKQMFLISIIDKKNKIKPIFVCEDQTLIFRYFELWKNKNQMNDILCIYEKINFIDDETDLDGTNKEKEN